jgi:DNA end-binding protein Ku
MRSIWTGAIGFGLVNIPVRMYSATHTSELDLDMLDKKDQSNIHFKRVNATTGKEVAWENIVRAYKYNGEYVVLSDADFAHASPKKSKIIEVTDFVQIDEIDSIYFENPYYLEPEKSGVKAYELFREALTKSKKAGVGSFVLRNKEHLCVLKTSEKVIVLNTIRYQEEIRDQKELDLPKGKAIKPGELKMAMSLIDQLTHPFSIDKFKNTYSADLLEIVKKKAQGKKPDYPKLKVTHRKTDDLMAQLKASLRKAS